MSASMNASGPASRPRRVLLIDDDAVSMDLLTLLLDHDGHQVMQASSGEAALHLLGEADAAVFPDVLLIDIQMPGLSGHEVARQAREMHGVKLLLLAMSATAVGREALHGFDGFLLKPLALDDLRRALRVNRGRRKPPPGGNGARRKPVAPLAKAEAVDNLIGQDAIDEGVLRKLQSAMPPGALKELYEACIADTRTRASTLKAEVRAGDMARVSQQGHQIKGAAAMVGFARVAKLALSLELGSCKEEDTLRLLDDLLSSCDELERILLAGNLQKTL